MNTRRVRFRRLGYGLAAAGLLGVVMAMAVSLRALPAETLPIEAFLPWRRWSNQTGQNSFDLSLCEALQAADADGDGRTDLICAYDYGSSQTRTFVQYSTGNSYTGWVNQHHTLLTGFDVNRCSPLLSGDIDNNGRADLICPYDYGSAQTATFVQRSFDDGYTDWQKYSDTTGINSFDLNRCIHMRIGDVNRDGTDDLICAYDYGGSEMRTFVQHTIGTYFSGWISQHPDVITGFDVGRCRPLLSGDLNDDDRTDLICPYLYPDGSSATWAQLAFEDGFTEWALFAAQVSATDFALDRCDDTQVGDVDGDGTDDLICAYDYGNAETRTFTQTSSGVNYSSWASRQPDKQTDFDVSRCRPILSGDLNNDGRADLICPYDYGSASTATFVQLSQGDGYTPWQLAGDQAPPGQFALDACKGIRVGDANGDGHSDLICPYDYGSASTATFVQAARVFRAILPAVVGE